MPQNHLVLCWISSYWTHVNGLQRYAQFIGLGFWKTRQLLGKIWARKRPKFSLDNYSWSCVCKERNNIFAMDLLACNQLRVVSSQTLAKSEYTWFLHLACFHLPKLFLIFFRNFRQTIHHNTFTLPLDSYFRKYFLVVLHEYRSRNYDSMICVVLAWCNVSDQP